MQEKWSTHKRACVIGARDLAVGKRELFKGCGVYIDKQVLDDLRRKK